MPVWISPLDEKLTFASCPGIQTTWPPAEIETGVMATIVQLYAILLSALFSVNRQQLSLFDANYALMVSSSPLAIYLVFSSIRSLLGFDTGLFKRVKFYPRVIRFFGALLLPLWLGLRLALPLSTKAFKDSGLCENPTFKDLFLDFLLFFFPLTGPTGGVWVILSLLTAYSLVFMVAVCCEVIVGFLVYQGGVYDTWEFLCSRWVFILESVRCVSVLAGARSAESDPAQESWTPGKCCSYNVLHHIARLLLGNQSYLQCLPCVREGVRSVVRSGMAHVAPFAAGHAFNT